jgi:cell division protein FtsW (lipid II flippase)
MTWIYAIAGLFALLVVLLFGATSYGAKLSVSIWKITVQPSEFVKILFVFFVAGMLHETTNFKQVCITTVVAAAHVLILVASKDLGGALIFFVTYLAMLYVATRKILYFLSGTLAGCIAAVVSYRMFSHVRVRVLAWQDPLSVAENEGYQVSQSLFGIGTGGWLGMGLFHGMPDKIPLVDQDFVFAGISEELGGAFALCLILVCVSCFLMFLNISMQMKDQFYKLTALGLGTVYGFQVFLNIGGTIKFIPSTGITLPLVSYGGSSLLCTMIIFAIIQGLYILRDAEGDYDDKKNNNAPVRKKGKKRKTGFDNEVEELS